MYAHTCTSVQSRAGEDNTKHAAHQTRASVEKLHTSRTVPARQSPLCPRDASGPSRYDADTSASRLRRPVTALVVIHLRMRWAAMWTIPWTLLWTST